MTTLPTFYDVNMAILKECHPHIWQMMIDLDPKPVGKICRADNKSINLIVTGEDGSPLPLHKDENPESEADDFLATIPADHTGFIALLGMGLGYAALGILEQRPLVQSLAVFERDPGIFRQALEYIDLTDLLKDKRLLLGIGSEFKIGDILAPAARTLQLECSRVLHHLQSFTTDPRGYKELKEQMFSHLNKMNVGGTTTKNLGRSFFNNRFGHITTIHHQLLLEHLQGIFTGVPAILVAGGPSLDKNIHLLKQVQDKAVILAVDTVLPALLEHGVNPHFLTSIDPNNLTYEKFATIIPKVKETSLICSSWVNPRTPQNFPAQQVFWTFTGNPMEAWLNSLLGGKIFTSGASTVAHLNLTATDILGCDPIIFIGQDLAYPLSSSHAQGTVLHGSAPTDPLPEGNTEGQLVKGIDGTMLRTNRSFLSMKDFFESVINNSSKTFINATEGGAHIAGTTVLSLQETIETYCRKETAIRAQIKKHINSAGNIDANNLLNKFRSTLNKAKTLLKHIAEADKLCKVVHKELNGTIKQRGKVRAFNMLPPKTQKKIDKIDKLHKKLDGATEIWRILEEITMDGLQASERERQAITVLENDPARYTDWLKQNLNRLTNINVIRKETINLLEGNLHKTLTFHKQESLLLEKITREENKEQNNLLLLKLYMDEGNYVLALPLAEQLRTQMPKSAEVFFALGCVKALRSEFVESDEYFQKAITLAPELTDDSKKFHHQLANDFLTYTQYFKRFGNRWPSVIYMVKKGLQIVPDHDHLLTELDKIIREDMDIFKANIANGNVEEATQNIDPWYDFLDQERQYLSKILVPDLVSCVYLNHGILLRQNNKEQEAIGDFKKGLALSPNDSDLNTALIDTFFQIAAYQEAIEALNNAIALDRDFAAYWETIGDSLQRDKQHDDAILAYEQCFAYLPENLGLLKKIGDCYQATDRLEAAKTAYQNLKSKLEQLS